MANCLELIVDVAVADLYTFPYKQLCNYLAFAFGIIISNIDY